MLGRDEHKPVIGWAEYVSFPEWGIRRMRAKVDTGARTSALHVENIRELPHDMVAFDAILHRKKTDRRIHIKAKIKRRVRVRSSIGGVETRFVVVTPIEIGPISKTIEVTLAARGEMVFRMLLGREALAGACDIDVGHKYLVTERPKRRRGSEGA